MLYGQNKLLNTFLQYHYAGILKYIHLHKEYIASLIMRKTRILYSIMIISVCTTILKYYLRFHLTQKILKLELCLESMLKITLREILLVLNYLLLMDIE